MLAWYKEHFKSGYQTAMHAVLQEYVDRQISQKVRTAGRAQEIFRTLHARCFWHYDKNLEITPDNLQLVVEGLRKYGGREGFLLASELCQ